MCEYRKVFRHAGVFFGTLRCPPRRLRSPAEAGAHGAVGGDQPAGASRGARGELRPLREELEMGRGDKGTRKGKISAGSFGNSRPHKARRKTKAAGTPTVGAQKSVPARGKA